MYQLHEFKIMIIQYSIYNLLEHMMVMICRLCCAMGKNKGSSGLHFHSRWLD